MVPIFSWFFLVVLTFSYLFRPCDVNHPVKLATVSCPAADMGTASRPCGGTLEKLKKQIKKK